MKSLNVEEEVLVSKDPDLLQRPSCWSDLRRRYFQRRYVVSWVVAVVLPFILLRLLFMSEFTFPFLSIGSSPISLEPEENVSDAQSPRSSFAKPPASDMSPEPNPDSPPFRPDEDAWISHDNWTNHHLSPRGDESTDHNLTPNERDNSTEFMKPFSNNTDDFGLPQDNDKEEQALEAAEKQADSNAGNAQQEKSEEEKNKDKHEKQTADNNNTEDQGEVEGTDSKAGHKEDAEETTEGMESERNKVEDRNDVSPKNSSEAGQTGGANEQHETKEHKPPEEKTQGEEQQEPQAVKQSEEERQPEEHEDKQGETTAGECDLFEGEWEHDPEGPLYTNSSCSQIQAHQNCMFNGRPDTDYLYWKWKPRSCDLPRFDAKSFLSSFRGKAIGFIGDSIARNQMQSLLCLLSQVEMPVETYQSADDTTVRWFFKEHQFTLAMVFSVYLLKHEDGAVMDFHGGENVLYLDVLDSAWTSVMQDFDVMVFITGQWYYKGSVYVAQEKVVGCHYCPGLNLTEISFFGAYRGAIRRVLEKVSNEFKGVAVMSTFPVAHYENGSWSTGGYCKRKQPLQPLQSLQFPGEHNQFREIVIQEFNDVVRVNREQNKDAHLELLDITKLSLQRADGHPNSYRFSPTTKRTPGVFVPNDCLHWCLPGPIEAWNQVIKKILERYF